MRHEGTKTLLTALILAVNFALADKEVDLLRIFYT